MAREWLEKMSRESRWLAHITNYDILRFILDEDQVMVS